MTTRSYEIRQALDHPVIDSDCHWMELYPVYLGYLAEVAGSSAAKSFAVAYGDIFGAWYRASPEQRRRERLRRPPYWATPVSKDRVATLVPRVFRESLDDWGIDVAIVYPTIGLLLQYIGPPDLSHAAIKAYNSMVLDLFAPYRDRVVPVGVINLSRPDLAIEQLEEAHALGLRQVVTGGAIVRPLEADAEWQPDVRRRRVYVDSIGLDSPYDYEPVWRRFTELGVAVTPHSGSGDWPDHASPTNFVANHLGHFAQHHHLLARSLVLGGVTQRHPRLNFGFLEGGVGWACNLLTDLREHWEKRNRTYLQNNLRPDKLDRTELRRQLERQAEQIPRIAAHIEEILAGNIDQIQIGKTQEELTALDAESDDFDLVDISGRTALETLFRRNFFFGCEADDPMTAVAFDPRLGMKLKPILGSDIAHFDVTDAGEVVAEAHELVEHGLITPGDFRDFVFRNPIRLFAGMNRDFFAGTILEADVQRELAAVSAAAE